MISDLYQLREEILHIADRQLRAVVATNIDDLLDHLIAKGDEHEDVQDERIPYFADLWPSSICLAEWVLMNPEIVRGKQVLELGCGIGLAGTAGGMAGASSVLQTDYLPDALEFAAHVWAMNNQQPAETAILDWRNPDPAMGRPVILAADVAYEERNFQPLLEAFHVLLPPDGILILTEPSRQVARPFTAMLLEHGFAVDTTQRELIYRELSYRIQVHRITHRPVH